MRIDGDVCILPCGDHPNCKRDRAEVAGYLDKATRDELIKLRPNVAVRLPLRTREVWVYVFYCNHYRTWGRTLGIQADAIAAFTGYNVEGGNWYHRSPDKGHFHKWRSFANDGGRLLARWPRHDEEREFHVYPILSSGNSSYYWSRDILRAFAMLAHKPVRCPICGKRRGRIPADHWDARGMVLTDRHADHKRCDFTLMFYRRLGPISTTRRANWLISKLWDVEQGMEKMRDQIKAQPWPRGRGAMAERRQIRDREVALCRQINQINKTAKRIDGLLNVLAMRNFQREQKEQNELQQARMILKITRKFITASDPNKKRELYNAAQDGLKPSQTVLRKRKTDGMAFI